MTRRTIQPIPNVDPLATPSVLTAGVSGGLIDAAFQDDAIGWLDGVQFNDMGELPIEGRRFSTCTHDWLVVPADEDQPAYPAEGLPDVFTPGLVQFFPWEFRARFGCATIAPGVDYATLASAALEQNLARALSHELWTGYYTGAHALTRDAVELTGGNAVPYSDAFGLILEAVAGAGTWHIPARLEPAVNEWVTANGNQPLGPGRWPISFGPSYPAHHGLHSSPWRRDVEQAPHAPDGPGPEESDGTPLGPNETFIIGHAGRFEWTWRTLDVLVPEQGLQAGGRQVHNLHTNAVEAMARGALIFRYNPSRVFAARVVLPPEYTAEPVEDEAGNPVVDESGNPVNEG